MISTQHTAVLLDQWTNNLSTVSFFFLYSGSNSALKVDIPVKAQTPNGGILDTPVDDGWFIVDISG
jgi:hypothetical protein